MYLSVQCWAFRFSEPKIFFVRFSDEGAQKNLCKIPLSKKERSKYVLKNDFFTNPDPDPGSKRQNQSGSIWLQIRSSCSTTDNVIFLQAWMYLCTCRKGGQPCAHPMTKVGQKSCASLSLKRLGVTDASVCREGTPNAVYASRPGALTLLAQFILQASGLLFLFKGTVPQSRITTVRVLAFLETWP